MHCSHQVLCMSLAERKIHWYPQVAERKIHWFLQVPHRSLEAHMTHWCLKRLSVVARKIQHAQAALGSLRSPAVARKIQSSQAALAGSIGAWASSLVAHKIQCLPAVAHKIQCLPEVVRTSP